MAERRQAIFFTGPEGSGKSTIAALVAKDLQVPHLSTGELVRVRAADEYETPIREACRNMNGYLSADVITQLIVDRLGKEDVQGGFIFDGVLRTQEETERWPTILDKEGINAEDVTVVNLRTPIWEAIGRMQIRGREDDTTPERMFRRLRGYYDGLAGRMSFANSQWRVEQVGTFGRTPGQVHLDVRARLGINN